MLLNYESLNNDYFSANLDIKFTDFYNSEHSVKEYEPDLEITPESSINLKTYVTNLSIGSVISIKQFCITSEASQG